MPTVQRASPGIAFLLVLLTALGVVAGCFGQRAAEAPPIPSPPTLRTDPHAVTLACNPAPAPIADHRMMEGTYLKGCWGHVGLHQYFFGHEKRLLLHGGRGRPNYPGILVTEIDQSVPQDPLLDPNPADPRVTVDAPILIETSMDGLSWTTVREVPYRSLRLDPTGSNPTDTGGGRQNLSDFPFELGAPAEFRFLRIVGPASHAGGLAGYIDSTNLELTVSEVALITPQALAAEASTRTLHCATDILEDLFPDHPCTFGGANHWDAPSFFHTYFLGEAEIRKVRAVVNLLPFRPHDSGQGAAGTIAGKLSVQASLDGTLWTNVSTPQDAAVEYGEDATLVYDVPPELGRVRFLRLAPELHPRYADVQSCAACHRPEAYFRSSEVTVDGRFAA